MTNKLEIKPERFAFTKSQVKFGALIDPKAATELIDEIERLRALLAAKPVPPIIQTLHANGDRIAMQATIAQQAQRIADLEGAAVVERQEPVAYVLHKNGAIDWDQEVIISNTGGDEPSERFKWVPVYADPPAPHVHEWDINEHGTATVCSLCGIRSSDEQPAPVAVVLEMVDVMSAVQQARGFPVLTSNHCHCLAEALNKIYSDKVKELNQ